MHWQMHRDNDGALEGEESELTRKLRSVLPVSSPRSSGTDTGEFPSSCGGGDDEGSFVRTQYSIFLATIPPGEFIDSSFGAAGERQTRKRERERGRGDRRRRSA